jgi:ubiquinone/menaquinone biosynthesis C-methylase UbiE
VSGDETATTETLRSIPGYVDPVYLQAAAAYLEQQKRRTYELLRLEPGHRVLDLGCGAASDTINLAGYVGPEGEVVGVDHDPEMVAEANRRAEAAGVAGWTIHIQADVASLTFESEHFDRTTAQRIFQHLSHPEAAFDELVRVTRRGGLILVAEPDWGGLSIDAGSIDLERRYVRYFAETYARNGFAGRQLFRLFASRHLEDLHVEMFPAYVTNYPLGRYFVLADRWERDAVEAGVFTQDEMDRLDREWQAADAAGLFFESVSMIGVVGRKP